MRNSLDTLWYEEDGDGGIRPIDDMRVYWATHRREPTRVVARTFFWGGGYITTDFTSLNLNCFRHSPPICYETMAFQFPPWTERRLRYQERYYTRAEALAGHAEWVKLWKHHGFKIRQMPPQPKLIRHRRPYTLKHS